MSDQMIPALIGAGIALSIGALILGWATACRRGTFPRNLVLGIRTPTTLGSQEAWVAAHQAGAHSLTIAGAGILLAAFIGIIFAFTSDRVPAAPLAFTLAFVWALGWIIASSLAATRTSKAVRSVKTHEHTEGHE